jgi:methionyl-tRNA formyltransferase
MKFTILCDNPKSWIAPYAKKLSSMLRKRGHSVKLVTDAKDIALGDCAFLLGCERVVSEKIRARNTSTLVVHESAVPKGKGWSPLTWQVLEGKRTIPARLIEAADSVDSGAIYGSGAIHLRGHELVEELREKQGRMTIDLVLNFVAAYPKVRGKKQIGKSTSYPRRTPKDSELDPNKTIAEQFDLLRVVDNERYPAFFRHRGRTYILKIYKKDEA